MRVSKISVTNLFGMFNHTIELKRDDRITIIHGPNGFGKTIILKMLYGFFNNYYEEIRDIPFDCFRVELENEDVVLVEKDSCDEQTNSNAELLISDEERSQADSAVLRKITVSWSSKAKNETQNFFLDKAFIKERRHNATMFRMEVIGRRLINETSSLIDETPSIQNMLELGSDHGFSFNAKKIPDWWKEFTSTVDIYLIEAQRLLSLRKDDIPIRNHKLIPVVEEYSEDLRKLIQKKLAEYADFSQELDRTFPVRLFEKMGQSKLTDQQLRDKLTELEEKRLTLKDVGLLDKQEEITLPPVDEFIEKTPKDVLDVYVHDVEKKLSIFDDISAKIFLFKEIVNKRFKFKSLKVSKELGLRLTSHNGSRLSVSALSSGEQHQLVLLYQLLFKVNSGSLILVDEPELSLHVAWQREFLSDLQQVTQIASLDVVLATHSPQIVHDRWDLTVELKGPAV